MYQQSELSDKEREGLRDDIRQELFSFAEETSAQSEGKPIIREIFLSVDFIGDEDEKWQERIYGAKTDYLNNLKESGVIENFLLKDQDIHGDALEAGDDLLLTTIFVAEVEFIPKKVLEYLKKINFKEMPISINLESGDITVCGVTSRFKIDSNGFKLFKVLYDNPNKMCSYEQIAIDAKIGEQDYPGSSTNKRLMQLVMDEIKGKLKLKKKDGAERNKIIETSNGYMLRR
jgi:hypothetical protein